MIEEPYSKETCDKNAECSNTNGGYECKCRTGFSGDGKTCNRQVLIMASYIESGKGIPNGLQQNWLPAVTLTSSGKTERFYCFDPKNPDPKTEVGLQR